MKPFLLLTLAGLFAVTAAHAQVNGDATISAPAFGLPLTVSTSSAYAGAVTSIKWGDKEFINNWDHGRQLQMNAQFFNRYECYNPYEAGSKFDGGQPSTSSLLLSLTASGNKLDSKTQMAWYLHSRLPRAEEFQDYCGDPSQWLPAPAYNGNPLSLYEVQKTLTIGYAGIPNVIEFLSQLYVPEPVQKGIDQIIAVVNYEFSSVWTFDLVSSSYRTNRATAGEDDMIKIVSTPDGNYAIGFYSPEELQTYHGTNDPANWWRVVPPGGSDLAFGCAHLGGYRRYDSFNGPGFQNDRGYFVIGNLAQVGEGLAKLHLQFAALDPDVFNWHDYVALNGLNPSTTQPEAETHWLTQGISQGLRGSKTFSASQYLELNPTVANASGTTNYKAAIDDYITSGRSQGKGTTANPTVGMQHAVVLANQSATAAGDNAFAQLGRGDRLPASTPVAVGLGSNTTEVVAGDYTSLAVKSDGTLWVWGSNQYGARGDGTVGGEIASPVQVPIAALITTPSRTGKHAVAVGTASYAAIDNQGYVWTWGANWNGRLGDGTQVSHFAPARVVRSANPGDYLTGIISITAAGGTMAAVDADGLVWTWGSGANGTLGNGSTQDSAFPMQVLTVGPNNVSTPLLGISQVACGSSGFCIALARYGQVFGWGSNDFSQMGIAPGGAFSVAMPIFAGPNGGIDAIAAGAAHCIAHNVQDGNVYGWGYNGRGQLGAGFANVAQFPPVVMGSGANGMNNISQLAAGGDSSFMMRYLDRLVFAAGDNQSGQLGIPGNQPAQYLPAATGFVH